MRIEDGRSFRARRDPDAAIAKAGYRREDAASLIASGTAMGMLVPPAIFMIILGEVTNTSVVALFVAGFIPAAVVGCA